MPAEPAAPRAQGMYRTAHRVGDLVVTAGMTPRVDGVMQYPGRVGEAVSLSQAGEAAEIAVRNGLRALATVVDPAEVTIVRLTVYVNAVADFADHPKVADFASRVLVDELGERGECVRSAVGVASLPGRACVELEITGRVRPRVETEGTAGGGT